MCNEQAPIYRCSNQRTKDQALTAVVEEAERRADEAERERRDEKRRADEAERERRNGEKRQQEAELLTRRTTLDEYIAATHDLVASHFAVETDKELTSKGPLTNRATSCVQRIYAHGPTFSSSSEPL
ncbi:hypothetical protein TruAng_012184 [Truncatella angustata]|nr:hypothetical protein TruAng_012184 [Truncatella angustata]